MPIMIQDTLGRLRGSDNDPSVSILLSTHRTFPDNKQDSIRLKNLITETEKYLYDHYEKRTVWPVLERIKETEAVIDHNYNLDSLALYANQEFATFQRLPLEVPDRVIIAPYFDLRSLYRALQQTAYYYVIVIGKNKIRLIEGYNDVPFKEVQDNNFPFENTQYYTTDPMKLQQASAVDNLVKEYFNVSDKRFQSYYQAEPLPVILLGDTRTTAYYKEMMDNKHWMIGEVAGSYEDASPLEIIGHVRPVVLRYVAERQQTALAEIEAAQSKQLLLDDLNDIYRAAMDGRGEKLMIETGFFQPGKIKDGIISVKDGVEEGHIIYGDVTNPIIGHVVQNSGSVVFLEDGSLSKYRGIALVSRY